MGRDLWMIMPPGILIVLAIVAFGLAGDGAQDHRSHQGSGPETSLDNADRHD